MIVLLPARVCSDYEGYSFFTGLNDSVSGLEFDQLILDFRNNSWFEANLCAILGAIFNKAQDNIKTVFLRNMAQKQHDILSRNHFLASFGGEKIMDHLDTTIKYRRNKLTDEKLIHQFLSNELLGKQDFPRLSRLAHKEIERSIFEIFSNAIIHGNCEHVYSCGQYFPQNRPPRIDFTIVDLGNTIRKNVNDFLHTNLDGEASIKWAVTENNTTKPKEDNIPGGIGLKIIIEFVQMNKGKLQIVSSNGFWEFNKGMTQSLLMKNEFPGTVVNIEFNLDDASFYYLKDEDDMTIQF